MITCCYTITLLHVPLLLVLLLRKLGQQGGACSTRLLLEVCLLQKEVCFLLFNGPYPFLQVAVPSCNLPMRQLAVIS